MSILQNLFRESESRFKLRKITYNPKELKEQIDGFYKQAEKKYLTLSEPKTCNREVYTDIWIWQEVAADIAKKSLLLWSKKEIIFL